LSPGQLGSAGIGVFDYEFDYAPQDSLRHFGCSIHSQSLGLALVVSHITLAH